MGSAMKRRNPTEAISRAYANEQVIAGGANPFSAGEPVSAERQQQAQNFCEMYGPAIEMALERTSSLPDARSEIQMLREDARSQLPSDLEAAGMIFGGVAMGMFAIPIAPFSSDITISDTIETIRSAREAPSGFLKTHEALERSMIAMEGSIKRIENSLNSLADAIGAGDQQRIGRLTQQIERQGKEIERAGEVLASRINSFASHAEAYGLAAGVVSEFRSSAVSTVASTVALCVGIGALGLAARGAASAARSSSYGKMTRALSEAGAFSAPATYTAVGTGGRIAHIAGKATGTAATFSSPAKIAAKGEKAIDQISRADSVIGTYNYATDYGQTVPTEEKPPAPPPRFPKTETGQQQGISQQQIQPKQSHSEEYWPGSR